MQDKSRYEKYNSVFIGKSHISRHLVDAFEQAEAKNLNISS